MNMAPHARAHSTGFTLVELSVVIVIIGLIVGGVVAGQSLIRASELRSISVDFLRYETAMNAFRDQYMGLPGDLPNATTYWGVAAGNGTGLDATCYDNATVGQATCNGNGDGLVSYGYGGGYGMYAENHRFWQHLANAGLISGHYTGQDSIAVPGINVPKSRFNKTGFDISYSPMGGSFGENFSTLSDGNALFFGNPGDITRGPALIAEDAWNIDTKMDDGKPDTGNLTVPSFQTTCYTSAFPNAAYNVTYKTVACGLRYLLK